MQIQQNLLHKFLKKEEEKRKTARKYKLTGKTYNLMSLQHLAGSTVVDMALL